MCRIPVLHDLFGVLACCCSMYCTSRKFLFVVLSRHDSMLVGVHECVNQRDIFLVTHPALSLRLNEFIQLCVCTICSWIF